MATDEMPYRHRYSPLTIAAAAVMGIGLVATVAVAIAAAVVASQSRASASGGACGEEVLGTALLAAGVGAFVTVLVLAMALCFAYPKKGDNDCTQSRFWCTAGAVTGLLVTGLLASAAVVAATALYAAGDCGTGLVGGMALAAVVVAWCTVLGVVAAAMAPLCPLVAFVCMGRAAV
jgi:hypothetical protein